MKRMRSAQLESFDLTIESLFSVRRLAPASIQRDYQWSQVESDTLVGDLIEAAETPDVPYFVGPMIAMGDLERQEFEIYDGLQRTITFTLLLAILRDRIRDEALEDRLHECIANDDGSFRLVMPLPDTTLPRSIQPRGATSTAMSRKGTNFGRRRVLRQSRNALEKRIRRLSPAEQVRLARFVLEQVVVVLVRVRDAEMATRVFETLNRRGRPVEEHELILTHLVRLTETEQEHDEVVGRWTNLRQTVDGDFPGFLEATCASWRRPGRDRRSWNQWLLDELTRVNGESHGRLLARLDQMRGHVYNWNRLQSVLAWQPQGWVRRLAPLGVFERQWNEWIPLALALLRRFDTHRSRPRIEHELDQLQRRCVALLIAGAKRERRYELFQWALSVLEDGGDPFDTALVISEPHRRRIRMALHGRWHDPVHRNIVLRWIEWLRSGQRSVLLPGITLEHVLPRNPPAGSTWFDVFPDVAERVAMLDKLGNLVLVPREVNDELENHTLGHKQAVLRRTQNKLGALTLVHDVITASRWDPETVRQRTHALAVEVWTALHLPGDPTFDDVAEE